MNYLLTCLPKIFARSMGQTFRYRFCYIMSHWSHSHKGKLLQLGEPWSSGYGRRLMFWRLWVLIPALYPGWAFFTSICCKIELMFTWKIPKRVRGWPILKSYFSNTLFTYLHRNQCDQIGLLLKCLGYKVSYKKAQKFVTSRAILKNVTIEVKTTVTTHWATFRSINWAIFYSVTRSHWS